MPQIVVEGGSALRGDIKAQGSKNAALPILAATLLSDKPVLIKNVPDLSDVNNMADLLRTLGCTVVRERDALYVDTSRAELNDIPEHLFKSLRSSIFLLGPMAARFSKASVAFPGGCEIGERPIDLHISAMRSLGAIIEHDGNSIFCDGRDIRSAQVYLEYPSVGATENAMMAAVAAKGESIIHHAAREPEIVDLQMFLNRIGCTVWGAGSPRIHVLGGCKSKEAEYSIIPDRIVTGTYLSAAAITGGDIRVTGTDGEQLRSVLEKLIEYGCGIEEGVGYIRAKGPSQPRAISRIITAPYPGFPTDMQAQLFALCTVACGTSIVIEKVFENRFKHAKELLRMGADCEVNERTAIIRGVKRLKGAEVTAHDLRGGAAMTLAGLIAEGKTTVKNTEHIDRGYEDIVGCLGSLGASIRYE